MSLNRQFGIRKPVPLEKTEIRKAMQKTAVKDGLPEDFPRAVLAKPDPEKTAQKIARKIVEATEKQKPLAVLNEDVLAGRKIPISIHLSPAIVEFFRATGRDWQPRINEVLAAYVDANRKELK